MMMIRAEPLLEYCMGQHKFANSKAYKTGVSSKNTYMDQKDFIFLFTLDCLYISSVGQFPQPNHPSPCEHEPLPFPSFPPLPLPAARVFCLTVSPLQPPYHRWQVGYCWGNECQALPE